MSIDTTIYAHIEIMRKISNVSSRSGQSKRAIVSRLLLMIADEKMIPPAPWVRIRYQKRDRKSNWQRVHVLLTPAEYELLLDLKKVYKLSGSGIIALAVERYVDKLSVVMTDNYRFACYVFSRFIMDGIICWAQYWGMPKNLNSFPDLPLPIGNNIHSRDS